MGCSSNWEQSSNADYGRADKNRPSIVNSKYRQQAGLKALNYNYKPHIFIATGR